MGLSTDAREMFANSVSKAMRNTSAAALPMPPRRQNVTPKRIPLIQTTRHFFLIGP